MKIRRRAAAVLTAAVAATGVAGPARASVPHEHPTAQGHSVRFDFGGAADVRSTLKRFGIRVPAAQAQCLAATYAWSGQPRSFRVPATASDAVRALLGGYGMVVWRGPPPGRPPGAHRRERLEDGAILPALAATVAVCGVGA